jgi:hypothetical protein
VLAHPHQLRRASGDVTAHLARLKRLLRRELATLGQPFGEFSPLYNHTSNSTSTSSRSNAVDGSVAVADSSGGGAPVASATPLANWQDVFLDREAMADGMRRAVVALNRTATSLLTQHHIFMLAKCNAAHGVGVVGGAAAAAAAGGAPDDDSEASAAAFPSGPVAEAGVSSGTGMAPTDISNAERMFLSGWLSRGTQEPVDINPRCSTWRLQFSDEPPHRPPGKPSS